MGRAPCCEKLGLKKGRWTAEEDEILTKYIQAHGEGSWRSLPKNAGIYMSIYITKTSLFFTYVCIYIYDSYYLLIGTTWGLSEQAFSS